MLEVVHCQLVFFEQSHEVDVIKHYNWYIVQCCLFGNLKNKTLENF
jgi:hypothetical protein